MKKDVGARPAGQALVSDEAGSRLHPSGFDPSRAGQLSRLIEALVDDPHRIDAGIPDAAIEAGIAAWDRARHDMENYVSGVTADWDEGMIVAAIFKAVARATLNAGAKYAGL